jgi:phospholipase C
MLKFCRIAALVLCSTFFSSVFLVAQNTEIPANISQIQHIIYIIKENRSFDSY